MPELTTQQKQEDHDRGIRIETKVTTLCKNVSELTKEFKDSVSDIKIQMEVQRKDCEVRFEKGGNDCGSCRAKLESEIQKKLDWKKFTFIVSLLILLIGGTIGWSVGVATTNRDTIIRLETTIEDHLDHFEKMDN